MHSRNQSAGGFSAASGRNPMAAGGRSRATSEVTLAPPGTSGGASARSATTSTFTLEGYVTCTYPKDLANPSRTDIFTMTPSNLIPAAKRTLSSPTTNSLFPQAN